MLSFSMDIKQVEVLEEPIAVQESTPSADANERVSDEKSCTSFKDQPAEEIKIVDESVQIEQT